MVCGSSFLIGLFLIIAALAAYVRVMLFSSKCESLGWRFAIIQHVEFPPRLCLSKQVSLLSRYGIYIASEPGPPSLFLSVKAEITLRSVKRLLLISIASFYILPSLPVRFYLSDPARSTICNFDTIVLSGLSTGICSTVIVKMV